MKNTLACFGLIFLVALLLPAGSSAQSAGDEAAAKITSKKKKNKEKGEGQGRAIFDRGRHR